MPNYGRGVMQYQKHLDRDEDKQNKDHLNNKAKYANKVRRVDCRTNALPNQPTDGHSQL